MLNDFILIAQSESWLFALGVATLAAIVALFGVALVSLIREIRL